MQDERAIMKKERETKDDGRYIIFFSFDEEFPDDAEAKAPSREDEG